MTPVRHSQVTVGGSSLHVVEAGDPDASPFVFLHGWPQSSRTWRDVMELAARDVHAIAIDLPGIGESNGESTDGSKQAIAALVHALIDTMQLRDVTLVGQDVGGVVAFHYLRDHPGLARAVLIDVVMPGVDPWDDVVRNPYVFHIALHSMPGLPETLVRDRQREYFDFFFDVLCKDPSAITGDARAEYAAAYASDASLTAGFNWYRGFPADAMAAQDYREVSTPVLYLRGEKGAGDMAKYVDGLRAAGLVNLTHDVVPGGGHFVQEEAPTQTWRCIAAFAADTAPGSATS